MEHQLPYNIAGEEPNRWAYPNMPPIPRLPPPIRARISPPPMPLNGHNPVPHMPQAEVMDDG